MAEKKKSNPQKKFREPRLQESNLLNMLPVLLFAAVNVLIVRMKFFTRPMSQFYWTTSSDSTQLTDVFSYYKMVCIVACAVISLLVILYHIVTQTFHLKNEKRYYIPMLVYAVFVILSYFPSKYKEFALLGWNDRFEGTITLVAYMVMLFYVINTINGEKNVRQMFLAMCISVGLLSLLGISQATGHDFFRTAFAQKLISPNIDTGSGMLHALIDEAAAKGEQVFEFTVDRQVYQTAYTFNYVSFYLTLFVPLVGMLFIQSCAKGSEAPLWKKIALALLFGLVVYNLLGASSAGGYLGVAVSILMAIIVLNKQILKMLKPLLILIVIAGLVMATNTDLWWGEVQRAFITSEAETVVTAVKESLPGVTEVYAADEAPSGYAAEAPATLRPHIEYFRTEGNHIYVSLNGHVMDIQVGVTDGQMDGIYVCDELGKDLELKLQEDGVNYSVEDVRFHDYMKIGSAVSDETPLITLQAPSLNVAFTYYGGQMFCFTKVGRLTRLDKVEGIGFANAQRFGTGRGYIWSRSIPLLKKSLLLGSGADTFCAVFPQNDYAGRYNTNFPYFDQSIIIDKPHNMYLGAGVGTGCISMLALLAIYGIYLVQSIRTLWKRELGSDYLNFAAAGIFLSVSGFLAAGLVNDSSVSVMPMFYSLLGAGIAVNSILKRRDAEAAAEK